MSIRTIKKSNGAHARPPPDSDARDDANAGPVRDDGDGGGAANGLICARVVNRLTCTLTVFERSILCTRRVGSREYVIVFIRDYRPVREFRTAGRVTPLVPTRVFFFFIIIK